MVPSQAMAQTDRDVWSQAIDILAAADRGELAYEIGEPWSYCGVPTYKIAGWTFAVFDDCGSWDYLEWIETPDGTRLEGDAGDELFEFWSYRPSGVLDKSYGLQMTLAGAL